MKTVTVKVMLYDGSKYDWQPVEAYPTANPHLFICKLGQSYNLSHDVSGACVMNYLPSLKVAQEWAARLSEVADFSQTPEQLKTNKPLLDLLREQRHSR